MHLPGGDLDIEWAANNHVYMTGPATTVFEAEFDEEFFLKPVYRPFHAP